jgi:hypothetical protein
MPTMLIFGLGYTAARLAERLRGEGWTVLATRREAADGALAFADEAAVRPALAGATHVLSSVPPDETGRDPVLDRYGTALGGKWLGYLSSTGVYGDTGGAWVDETMTRFMPRGPGRRAARFEADQAWLGLNARVARLPGIYGPGRSALERVRDGRAHRVALPGQVFSRVHVDDIVAGVLAALDGPPGAYNLADERPCAQDLVVEEAAQLLGLPPPPIVPLESLSPIARGFHAENRRIATARARRVLGWRPRFPDYRAGLADCLARSATASPPSASSAPAAAPGDQR